jgi:hypothetical protein
MSECFLKLENQKQHKTRLTSGFSLEEKCQHLRHVFSNRKGCSKAAFVVKLKLYYLCEEATINSESMMFFASTGFVFRFCVLPISSET